MLNHDSKQDKKDTPLVKTGKANSSLCEVLARGPTQTRDDLTSILRRLLSSRPPLIDFGEARNPPSV